MTLRRLHLLVGLVFLVVFAGTGLVMKTHVPPLREYEPFIRALFRSRHLFIMFGAGANALLGLYLRDLPGWARHVQRVGSALLLVSPPLALVGFFRDPVAGTLAGAAFGKFSAFALFGGTVLHVLGAVVARAP